jgi:hypothetical protein
MADTGISATETRSPRLFTRAEVLAALKIGETTLFWLQRTRKLQAVRIGRRVLFNAKEINRLAAQGATLTADEKRAASSKAATVTQKAQPKSNKQDNDDRDSTSRTKQKAAA